MDTTKQNQQTYFHSIFFCLRVFVWSRFIVLFMVLSGWHSLFKEHHASPVGNKLTHIQSKLNENLIVNDFDKPCIVIVIASNDTFLRSILILFQLVLSLIGGWCIHFLHGILWKNKQLRCLKNCLQNKQRKLR